MASVIQIANRALTKLGAARIISLNDDVKAARSILSCFDDLRDDELRRNRWSFALKRTTLAALSTAPAFGYSYQYQLPADCLKIDMIDDRFPTAVMDNYISAEYVDWVLENGLILTDIAAPLSIRYLAQITDPTLFDPSFREALACRIAVEICEDLTQSVPKREMAWKEYERAIKAATKGNAIERLPMMPPDNTWIISRI